MYGAGERGDRGNEGNAAFEKAWQNFCEKKDGISFVRGLGGRQFCFVRVGLLISWHIAQWCWLWDLKFLFFPLEYDLISCRKYGILMALDVR